MNNNLSIIFRKSTKISDLNSKEMETGLGNLERDKLIFEVPGDESKNLYWIYPSIHEIFGAFTVITVDS